MKALISILFIVSCLPISFNVTLWKENFNNKQVEMKNALTVSIPFNRIDATSI